jgi:hypothetical protein
MRGYVLAFNPTFIEVYHCSDGLLQQIVRGTNIRLLQNSISSTFSGLEETQETEHLCRGRLAQGLLVKISGDIKILRMTSA